MKLSWECIAFISSTCEVEAGISLWVAGQFGLEAKATKSDPVSKKQVSKQKNMCNVTINLESKSMKHVYS